MYKKTGIGSKECSFQLFESPQGHSKILTFTSRSSPPSLPERLPYCVLLGHYVFIPYLPHLTILQSSISNDSLRAERPGDRILVGARFSKSFQNGPGGPPSLLYNRYWVFLGGKASRVWRWPPTTSSAEVKGGVELYLYPFFGPSWSVLGWNFTQILTI